MITFTFDFDSIHIGLLNAVHHCENICHLSCSHILAFPPAITNVKAMLETPRSVQMYFQLKLLTYLNVSPTRS